MKVTTERIEHCRVVLEVEVEPDRFGKATDRAFQQLSAKVHVPGFRPGKAPRHVLRNYLGENRVRQEALQTLLPEAYKEAVVEAGIHPVAEPDLEIVRMEAMEPLVFKATVPVEPVVELGDLSAIPAPEDRASVSDEAVEKEIESLRQSHADWVPVERPAEPGDQITFDLHTTPAEFQAKVPWPTEVELGLGQLPAEIEDGLIGARAGDDREIVILPTEDGGSTEPVTHSVHVHGVRAKEVPTDDDLVALTEGVDSMDALREQTRTRVQEAQQHADVQSHQRAILDNLEERSRIEFPSLLVDREIEHMARSAASRMAQFGFTFDRYLQLLQITPAQYVEQSRPQAERTVRDEVVLDKLAETYGIEPDESAVAEQIKNVDDARTIDPVRLELAVRLALRRQAALRFLHERVRENRAVEQRDEAAGAAESVSAGESGGDQADAANLEVTGEDSNYAE